MKIKTFLIGLIITMPLLATACSGAGNESAANNASDALAGNVQNSAAGVSSVIISSNENSSPSPAGSVPAAVYSEASEVPEGKPTIFTKFDGTPILTSEISAVVETYKAPEDITDEDYGAIIKCEGFAYVKEPLGIGYDNYRNPELFEGDAYLGEIPENNNEWKLVRVGDEICGRKVTAAVSCFAVGVRDMTFPGHYYEIPGSYCELEGTIEAEGYFQITAPSEFYPESGEIVTFYPTAIDLPLMPGWRVYEPEGFLTSLENQTVYNFPGEFGCLSEFCYVNFGKYYDMSVDLGGLRVGDVAYARVTLGNIMLTGGGCINASLENVELLSDVLAHDE